MRVDLRTLKDNPLRNFKLDPIDKDRVADLAASITDDGFWGGIACRKTKTDIEIAAGHHRVRAALMAGVTHADIFVSTTMDDAGMIRVYARENATQRGDLNNALAGAVACALRYVAKAVMTGMTMAVSPNFGMNADSLAKTRGNLSHDKGIGEPIITAFLKGIPGFNKSAVTAQLANLKAAGIYADIINEVSAEVEEETRAAAEAYERAEREKQEAEARRKKAEEERKKAEEERKAAAEERRKAKEEKDRERAKREEEEAKERERKADERRKKAEEERKAAEQKMKEKQEEKDQHDTATEAGKAAGKPEDKAVFDLVGVSKHLKNEHQVRVFRECVLGAGIRPYLTFDGQAALAAELVRIARKRAKDEGKDPDRVEISGAFIRDHITMLVLDTKHAERKMTAEERAALELKDMQAKLDRVLHEASRHLRMAAVNCLDAADLMRKLKKTPYRVISEFSKAVGTWRKASDALEKIYPID